MTVKLPTKHDLEFLSLKGGCTGSSESTLVKMPHCWKSHVEVQFFLLLFNRQEEQMTKFMSDQLRVKIYPNCQTIDLLLGQIKKNTCV